MADLFIDPAQDLRDFAGAVGRRRRQRTDALRDQRDVGDALAIELAEIRGDQVAHRGRGGDAALHLQHLRRLGILNEEIDDARRLVAELAAGIDAPHLRRLEILPRLCPRTTLRIHRHAELVLVDRLVADQEIRVLEGGRRLALRQHRGLVAVAVERLHIGGDARLAFAHIVPISQPIAGIRGVEAELALLRIERLAALAHPNLEGRLGAATVHGAEIGALVRLGEFGAELGELCPARLVGRRLQPRILVRRPAVEHCRRIEAEADAVELAVDTAAVDRILAEIGDAQLLRHEGVERQQGAAPGIFVDVAVIHLQDVGGVASRGLGRQARPVIAPAERLTVDRHPGMARRIELVDLEGAIGALLAAPPVHAQPLILCERGRKSAGGERERADAGFEPHLEQCPSRNESCCHRLPPVFLRLRRVRGR